MASKNPELGRCSCPSCEQGELIIRQRRVGQGGNTKMLYGYCADCRHMPQGKDNQEWLRSALETPVSGDSDPYDGFDPAEVAPVQSEEAVKEEASAETSESPAPTTGHGRGGRVLKFLGIAAVALAGIAGVRLAVTA